jgi:NitT/TauT family transport system substrate-binding protein
MNMIRLVLPLCFLLIFSSCDEPLKKVHVGTTPFFGEAAFYVAQEQGFFEDQGLDVTSHSHIAGKESLKKLYSKEIDIAHTAELPFVYATNGSPEYKGDITPKISANMIYNSDMQKIIARKDKGIENPTDLANKKVGYYKGTTSEFFLDTFLLEHNIPDTAIDKQNISVAKQLEALKSGKVDAVASWEPYPSKILSQMSESTFELNTRIDHSTLWLVVASEGYISENPEIIKSYLQALQQAQGWITSHPDQAQSLLAQKINTPEEIIATLWNTIDYELSLSERMLVLMEDQQRWLRQKQYIDHPKEKTNFEDMVYFRAMEQVYPEGITIIR